MCMYKTFLIGFLLVVLLQNFGHAQVLCQNNTSMNGKELKANKESNVPMGLLQDAQNKLDMKRKHEILQLLETLRSYYEAKDLKALRNFYSDDAQISTGKVIVRNDMGSNQPSSHPEVVYSQQDKSQYFSNLYRTFSNNQYIKVIFDKINVKRHPAKDGFYSVTLHENWQSSNYSDDGYVYLLWQFPEDGGNPVIHEMRWQPEIIGSR